MAADKKIEMLLGDLVLKMKEHVKARERYREPNSLREIQYEINDPRYWYKSNEDG